MSKSNSLPGRPPRSADATRKRILAAAQRSFSSRGYKDVGLREIAALAGCDTTLIRRYFGAKERLFEAALAETLDDVGALLDGPRDGFGERAVAFFNEGRGEVQAVRMLIFATSDTVSRAIALRLMEELVVKPIAAWLDRSDGRTPAIRLSMLCSGYFLYAQVLELKPESEEARAATDRWLAVQLQDVVDAAA